MSPKYFATTGGERYLKAQVVLSLVPLPKIDEFCTMLNGSAVYSSLDCTSRYHFIALLPDAEKEFASVTLIGKSEFEKVPLV